MVPEPELELLLELELEPLPSAARGSARAGKRMVVKNFITEAENISYDWLERKFCEGVICLGNQAGTTQIGRNLYLIAHWEGLAIAR